MSRSSHRRDALRRFNPLQESVLVSELRMALSSSSIRVLVDPALHQLLGLSVSNAVHYLHDELKGDSNNWDPDGRSGDASSEGVEDEDEENNDNPPNFLGCGKDPAVDVGGNEPSSPSLVGLNIIDIGEDSEDTDWEVSSKLESSNSPRDCCEYDSNGSE